MNEDNIKLTPRQELFVEFYTQCKNGLEAARMAGYAGNDNVLKGVAFDNLSKPHIIQAVELKKNDLRKQFESEARNAFAVMIGLMNNPHVSPRTRLDACKDVLDRAGYKPSDKLEVTGKDGNPLAFESRATKEIVNRARLLIEENTIDVESSEISEGRYVVVETDTKPVSTCTDDH